MIVCNSNSPQNACEISTEQLWWLRMNWQPILSHNDTGISTTRPFSHTDYPRQEEEKTACPKLPSHYDGTNFHLSKKRIICVKDYVALWMANKSNLATKVIYVELRPSNSAQHGFIILLSHPLAPTDLAVPPMTFRNLPSALTVSLWHAVTPPAHGELTLQPFLDWTKWTNTWAAPFMGAETPLCIMDCV